MIESFLKNAQDRGVFTRSNNMRKVKQSNSDKNKSKNPKNLSQGRAIKHDSAMANNALSGKLIE
jgi:hypothetical protein